MIPRLLIAGLLLGHALVHAAYLAPRPPVTAGGPAWPFELGRSWAFESLGAGAELSRLVGIALIALTIGGFALAALGAIGAGPAFLWPAGIAVGAVASVGVLALFFHPWLVVGLAIDVVLLWAALVARWTPEVLGS